MELGLNKITGTDRQTVEMLKDKVISGGCGGSGSLGVSFVESIIEEGGALTKTIDTEMTDLSNINFVFVKELTASYDESGVLTYFPGFCPVISKTSQSLSFLLFTDNGGSYIYQTATLDLTTGFYISGMAEQEGQNDFVLYSL